MKTRFLHACVVAAYLVGLTNAYSENKSSVAILKIESIGFAYNEDTDSYRSKEITSLARIELEKLGLFEVMGQHDIKAIELKSDFIIDNCFTKDCLIKAGRLLKVDKIVTGNIQKINSKVIVSLKLIDVKNDMIEKSELKEFIEYKDLQKIINVTLHSLFSLPQEISEVDIKAMTQHESYESKTNNPGINILKLSGPRVGFTIFSGETASILKNKYNEGGFEAIPVMFQFGYQFERQYLNSDNFQALFEFVPMVTGLDQNIFIPSLSILNGFRNNKNGLEIAFGPSLYFVKKSEGYYMNDQWVLLKPDEIRDGKDIMKRIDSRGEFELSSSFVVAVGKSFRAGNLNIPMNVYFIPSSKSPRFGFSLGFNVKKGGRSVSYKYN